MISLAAVWDEPQSISFALFADGGCVHHDNGPLGSKAIGRAEERRVELLKANGYNAIRTSHNPVSRAFVAACNKLGVMLMEEAFDCWAEGKNVDDYHLHFNDWWQRDVASMVLRDRNAPSIIMWSIGNEIPMRRSPEGIALSAQISVYIRSLDPSPTGSTRAVTSAYPGVGEDNATDAYMAPLDVAGYNCTQQLSLLCLALRFHGNRLLVVTTVRQTAHSATRRTMPASPTE